MKNTLLILGGLISSVAVAGVKKLMDYKEAIESFKVDIANIHGIKIDLGRDELRFNLDLNVTNHSSKDFSVSTANLVTITKVFIYDKNGKLLATALPALSSLKVAANSTSTVRDLPCVTHISAGINQLLDKANLEQVNVTIEVKAFNKVYTTKLN